ncbi:hypothetical protein [Dasineura jujubifolia toursvirus 2a]|nr:hypothetical protein [Dasineura jujubifolia toursvirus 2a]
MKLLNIFCLLFFIDIIYVTSKSLTVNTNKHIKVTFLGHGDFVGKITNLNVINGNVKYISDNRELINNNNRVTIKVTSDLTLDGIFKIEFYIQIEANILSINNINTQYGFNNYRNILLFKIEKILWEDIEISGPYKYPYCNINNKNSYHVIIECSSDKIILAT